MLMKKTLLLSAALVAGFCAFAQEGIDVTPSNYHFGSAEKLPFGTVAFKNVNISGTPWTDAKGEEEFDGGLWTITTWAGNTNTPEAADLLPVLKSWQLVDLGGEVGQVAMYNGSTSTFIEKLKEARPGEDWSMLKAVEINPGTVGINMWMDPDFVNTSENGWYYHASIEMMAYCNNPVSEDVIFNKVGAETVTNNVRSFGAPGITIRDFVELDEEGDPYYDEEGNVISGWDPTRWVVYEFNFSIPEEAGCPGRLRFELAGLDNKTVLLKDITITAIEDAEYAVTLPSGDGVLDNANVTKSYNTYESIMNPIAGGENGVESIGNDVNAPVVYYNLQGVKVSNPEKGIFLKKQGNKVSKVVL